MDITDLDALLQSARQAETTVQLCLRGDLQADWEDLDRRLQEMRSQGTEKLAELPDAETVTLAEEIRALEAQMTDATIPIRLRALRRRPWVELIEAHPPRPDNDQDKLVGLNNDTFYEALISACLVSPAFSAEQITALLDSVTSSQYDALSTAAWTLNRRDVAVPFSHTASRIATISAGTSTRPSDSASATNGSLAGNRKKSPSTRTTKAAG